MGGEKKNPQIPLPIYVDVGCPFSSPFVHINESMWRRKILNLQP
jgi:hypothetical protein